MSFIANAEYFVGHCCFMNEASDADGSLPMKKLGLGYKTKLRDEGMTML